MQWPTSWRQASDVDQAQIVLNEFHHRNQDLARFPQQMVAKDEKIEAVFEMEPKEEIFRSFHFHHKSLGKQR